MNQTFRGNWHGHRCHGSELFQCQPDHRAQFWNFCTQIKNRFTGRCITPTQSPPLQLTSYWPTISNPTFVSPPKSLTQFKSVHHHKNVVKSAQQHRLAPGDLPHDVLDKILNHTLSVARKRNMLWEVEIFHAKCKYHLDEHLINHPITYNLQPINYNLKPITYNL